MESSLKLNSKLLGLLAMTPGLVGSWLILGGCTANVTSGTKWSAEKSGYTIDVSSTQPALSSSASQLSDISLILRVTDSSGRGVGGFVPGLQAIVNESGHLGAVPVVCLATDARGGTNCSLRLPPGVDAQLAPSSNSTSVKLVTNDPVLRAANTDQTSSGIRVFSPLPPVGFYGQRDLTSVQQEQGFSSPSLAIRVGSKFLVSSTTHNRILIFNRVPSLSGVAVPDLYLGSGSGSIDQAIYGFPVAANTLHQPTGMASDGTRLVVADTNNNRVLIWNQFPSRNRQPADVVIGQSDFISSSSSCSRARMNSPRGVWIGSDGVLYVADSNNHRVLVYSSIPTSSEALPAYVIGQADFNTCSSSATPTANTFIRPLSVYTQAGKLFVADSGNNRVLIFDLSISRNSATRVLGQVNLTSNNAAFPPTRSSLSSPSYITGDGDRIVVSDLRNNRILIWNSLPPVLSASADYVLGQQDFTTNAINYLGLSAGTLNLDRTRNINGGGTGSAGLFYDGSSLYAADALNHRVLVWNGIPTSNGALANVVIGQPDASSSFAGGVSGRTSIAYPNQLVAADGRLAVASAIVTNGTRYGQDNRVLIWNSVPSASTAVAPFNSPSVVLGQADFTTNQPNFSSGSTQSLYDAVGAQGMEGPMGVAWDGAQFYVSDSQNHRVLVYSGVPGTSGAHPSGVIGQANLTSNSSGVSASKVKSPAQLAAIPASADSPSRLIVPELENNRVLIFNNPPASPSPGYSASVVLGQENFTSNLKNAPLPGSSASPTASNFNGPRSATTDGIRLVISDSGNHRVLIWDRIPTVTCPAANPFCHPANLVLGQPDFNSNVMNNGGISAHSLKGPRGVFTDGTRLVIADAGNNRVLVWNRFPTSNNQDADQVFGQADFVSLLPNRGGSPGWNSLSFPVSAIIHDHAIYISDSYNYRILSFKLR